MVGERLLDLSLVCPGAYADFRVEGVKSEDVVMRSVARRRARSPVAVRPEVVASLGRRRLPFGQLARGRVEPPGEPLGESSSRRVWILDDERERLRFRRPPTPGEWRGEIVSFARVPGGIASPSWNAGLVSAISAIST